MVSLSGPSLSRRRGPFFGLAKIVPIFMVVVRVDSGESSARRPGPPFEPNAMRETLPWLLDNSCPLGKGVLLSGQSAFLMG